MIRPGQPRELWLTDTHQDQYGISLRIKKTLFRKQSAHQIVEVLDTEGFGRLLVLDGIRENLSNRSQYRSIKKDNVPQPSAGF